MIYKGFGFSNHDQTTTTFWKLKYEKTQGSKQGKWLGPGWGWFTSIYLAFFQRCIYSRDGEYGKSRSDKSKKKCLCWGIKNVRFWLQSFDWQIIMKFYTLFELGTKFTGGNDPKCKSWHKRTDDCVWVIYPKPTVWTYFLKCSNFEIRQILVYLFGMNEKETSMVGEASRGETFKNGHLNRYQFHYWWFLLKQKRID